MTKVEAMKLLGLTSIKSVDDIKKAYKNAALKYHPDVCVGGTEVFIKICDAYSFLLSSTAQLIPSRATHNSIFSIVKDA